MVNSLVSLTAFFKLFTFFRAFPTMAKMVILITQVMRDLVPFILIYLLFVVQTVVSYTLAGVEFSRDDYKSLKGMPMFIFQFLSSFRNSLGDIVVPEMTD